MFVSVSVSVCVSVSVSVSASPSRCRRKIINSNIVEFGSVRILQRCATERNAENDFAKLCIVFRHQP